MPNIKEIVNMRTGVAFDNNPNLLAYAMSDPTMFKIVYDEAQGGVEEETYTEEQLKAMNMRDLQLIADNKQIACDRRRKDSLIDGILGRG